MNNIMSKKACAACNFQRRKCSQDCLLSCYFPANNPEMFNNAHRLYGVSNMVKILNRIPKEKRDLAMRTIIYESYVRVLFPVHGCFALFMKYRNMIKECMEELDQVKMLLNNCKSHHLQQQNPSSLIVSNNGSVGQQNSARDDLKEAMRYSNNDELDVSDYGVDQFLYIDGKSYIY